MKTHLIITAIAVLTLFPFESFAQKDERKPGIYAVVEEKAIPLTYLYGKASVSGENFYGVEVSYNTYRFNGESSPVTTDSTFILVIDPQKREVVRKMKEYDPFIKSMKPAKLIVIPLTVNSEMHCREYYQGMKLETIRVDDQPKIEFDWGKLSENSYVIRVHGLKPGEYGFVFKPEGGMGFDYTAIFDFTIPDKTE